VSQKYRNRIIEVNHPLNTYRRQAKERLTLERGLFHRSQRPQEVEAVFGHIKSNRKFNRFMLKGLQKTEIEIGWLSLAHDLRKKCSNVWENVERQKESSKRPLTGFADEILISLVKNLFLTVSI